MTKTFTFFQVHYNDETSVKLGILQAVDRVSEVVMTSEDLVSWSPSAQEVLADFNLPKAFTDAGLAHARQRSQTACEVVPQMELGFFYGGSDNYPQWARTFPVVATVADPDLTADRVREWFEDLGRRSATAKEEIDAWRSRMRRNLNAALVDLQEGNIFPGGFGGGRGAIPLEEVLGKTLGELECAYSSGPVLAQTGPYRASLWLDWDRVLEISAAAKAACEAREAILAADREAARQARRAFQVRQLETLGASPEDVERATRGFFPPDELLERLLKKLIPSAELLNCDGFISRAVSLTADRFARLRELEAEKASSAAAAQAAGVAILLEVVEATWERGYDDDPAVPAVRVTIFDSVGGSSWERACTVSLFPHSSSQG